MLVAMFASPIFTVARASPMVWMKPQVALRRYAHAEMVRESHEGFWHKIDTAQTQKA
jgi:hypothetical protein